MCALRPPVPATLKAKALQLLAMRDYSRAEMEGKLQQWLRTRTAKDADPAAAKNADAMHAAETGAISLPGITEYSAALMEQQQGQIDTVLDELQAKGLLSDQRAAEAQKQQLAAAQAQAQQAAIDEAAARAVTAQQMQQPVPAAAPASAPADPLAQLERLAQLHERGLLSADEFAAAKAKLLGL